MKVKQISRTLAPMLRRSALALALATTPALLPAASIVKPKAGLWEHQAKISLNGNDVLAGMAAARAKMMERMTPEQRAMMEAQMAKQGIQGDQRISKSCVTEAELAKINSPEDVVKMLNDNSEDQNCVYTATQSSAKEIKFHGVCKAGAQGFNGDINGVMAIDSPTAWTMTATGKGTMTMTAEGGAQPMNMESTIQSKWLGADCGDVPPGGD